MAVIASEDIGPGFVCSSPAISFNVDDAHNMWVFVTSQLNAGRLWAFRATPL